MSPPAASSRRSTCPAGSTTSRFTPSDCDRRGTTSAGSTADAARTPAPGTTSRPRPPLGRDQHGPSPARPRASQRGLVERRLELDQARGSSSKALPQRLRSSRLRLGLDREGPFAAGRARSTSLGDAEPDRDPLPLEQVARQRRDDGPGADLGRSGCPAEGPRHAGARTACPTTDLAVRTSDRERDGLSARPGPPARPRRPS